jgi:serine/threonine protein kinase
VRCELNVVSSIILLQVLLALNDLREKKIVHRDLKPENLVLDTNGYCILIDFGIAKRCHGPNYTSELICCAAMALRCFVMLIRRPSSSATPYG